MVVSLPFFNIIGKLTFKGGSTIEIVGGVWDFEDVSILRDTYVMEN